MSSHIEKATMDVGRGDCMRTLLVSCARMFVAGTGGVRNRKSLFIAVLVVDDR